MRYVLRLIGFGAVAAAAAALPAEAGQGSQAWAKVGEWEVGPFKIGFCSAARVYPGGTRVSVSSHSSGYAGLSVLNRAWSMRTSGPYRLRLIQGGRARDFAAEADPYSHGLGRSSESGEALLAQLAAGGAVEVIHPDGALLERVDLGGPGPALALLGRCIREAATAANFQSVAPPPPPPPAGVTPRPAQPQVPLHRLFSNEDYPAEAIRAREEGNVGFRLTVGNDGRVTNCVITSSSGSAILDAATCRLTRARARFTPATGSDGKPTEDSFSARIAWRLPPAPVPPPPLSP
jgi:protein TonB